MVSSTHCTHIIQGHRWRADGGGRDTYHPIRTSGGVEETQAVSTGRGDGASAVRQTVKPCASTCVTEGRSQGGARATLERHALDYTTHVSLLWRLCFWKCVAKAQPPLSSNSGVSHIHKSFSEDKIDFLQSDFAVRLINRSYLLTLIYVTACFQSQSPQTNWPYWPTHPFLSHQRVSEPPPPTCSAVRGRARGPTCPAIRSIACSCTT